MKGGYKPFFCYTFIFFNIAIFAVQLSTPGYLVCDYAVVPTDILAGKNMHTLLTSMFLHGGWMHLIGNMLFLWVFADNIEAVIGNFKFLAFYIVGGLVGTFAHIYMEAWGSDFSAVNCCIPCLSDMNCKDAASICAGYIPSLGASGAISAVMGAYIVLFPRSRVKVLFLVFTFYVPAIFFLGFWFAEQLIAGVGSIGPVGPSAGVAWWAHIGGFVFGLIIGFLNRDKMSLYERVYTEE